MFWCNHLKLQTVPDYQDCTANSEKGTMVACKHFILTCALLWLAVDEAGLLGDDLFTDKRCAATIGPDIQQAVQDSGAYCCTVLHTLPNS